VQFELEIAAFNLPLGRRLTNDLVRPLIPEHHAAPAIIARWNISLKCAVIERVVLHLHGECFARRVQTRPLRYSPTHQHAIHFQPEIVVQMGGIMPLHAIESAAAAVLSRRFARRRFRSLFEIAFTSVLFECHLCAHYK